MGVRNSLQFCPTFPLLNTPTFPVLTDKMLVSSLLPLLLVAVPGQASPRAEALLDGLVSDLTSPFINFFRGAGRDKPRRPRPVHHHHHQQHHHQPSPSSYHRPSPPVYSPAPVYHHPAPEPPAPKPQIQVLPAPDLTPQSYSVEPPQTYAVEPEQPAVAPAYEPSYEEPAVAPAYEPSYQTIYYNAEPSPPVYSPQTYEPAVVDNQNIADAIVLKEAEEEVEVEQVDGLPDLPLPVISVDPLVDQANVEREPKLLVEDPLPVTPFIHESVEEEEAEEEEEEEEEEIIIDLTQDVGFNVDFNNNEIILSSPEEETEAEVLVTGDQPDKKSQIISFTTNQIPNVFAPVQISNEVISFVPVQPVSVQPASQEEAVTPIAEDQDLRVLVQQEPQVPVENLPSQSQQDLPQDFPSQPEPVTFAPIEDIQPVLVQEPQVPVEDPQPVLVEEPLVPVEDIQPVLVEEPLVPVEEIQPVGKEEPAETEESLQPFEVIDLRNDNPEDSFALIDEDYIDQNQESDEDLDLDILIPEVVREEFEAETATDIIPESFDTTTAPSLPQTTLTDFSSSDLVVPSVPPTIASDPVFREIISTDTKEEKDQVKRGFAQYDPRHSRVYAHKYRDEYSNWYYFRRGY